MTVFCPIYFPASSYPVFVFVFNFVKNNHGCLGVIQSLQYKNLSKAALREQTNTGGSCLSRTVVKPDSRLARIFVAKFLCIIKLIIVIG